MRRTAFVAITRAVSPAITRCELTHVPRAPIDLGLARAQHDDYERTLAALGGRIIRLPAEPDLPDSVFVEDVALVFDEVAVMTRPGAPSRRAETDGVAAALRRFRPLAHLEAPATLDGGDVLRAGRMVFVGRSRRTNEAGRLQLQAILGPLGYSVTAAELRGCLHLKSGVARVGRRTLLINRRWVDPEPFAGFDLLDVDPREPFAANALWIEGRVVYPDAHPRTRARLEARGVSLLGVDASELAKAEGGVTCCSLILPSSRAECALRRGAVVNTGRQDRTGPNPGV